MELQVHDRLPGELLAQWGPLLLRVIDGGVTSHARIDRGYELLGQMFESHQIIALVALVEHGTPMPTVSVQRYAKERFGSYGDRLISAYAPLGLGFWASAAQHVGIMLGQVGGQTLLFDTTVEGIATKVSMELVGLDREQLIEACEQLRATLGARSSVA